MFTNIQASGDILRLISGKSKKDENSQKAERSFLTLIEDSYNKIISHESDSIDDSNLDMFVADDSNEELDTFDAQQKPSHLKAQSFQKEQKKLEDDIRFASMTKPRYEFNTRNINMFTKEANSKDQE